MNTYIALFRGINVGGNNIIPMKDLRALLESIRCTGVTTYIQSGNVVLHHETGDAGSLAGDISRAVEAARGFEPNVLLLTRDGLERAIAANPFPEAENEPKTLHSYFLAGEPAGPDTEGMESLRSDSERFLIAGSVCYLHAPDGIGRSKLAAKIERLLGVPATARNWRTVRKLAELAREAG